VIDALIVVLCCMFACVCNPLCMQVVKEKEQLAGIDKQKETLMASKL